MRDCSSIKKQFSAYIDSELNSDEIRTIKDHLKICRDCAQELNELEKSIKHLRALDKVEPPPWLTKKVIESIKTEWANIETPSKKSLFEKIFYPIYVKVPVGAVAAIFIVVITVYFFKVIEPAMEYKAPQESSKESLEETELPLPSDQKAKEYILGSELAKNDIKLEKKEIPKKELSVPPVMKDYEKSKTYPSALAGAVSTKEPLETKSLKSTAQKLEADKDVLEQKEYATALDKRSIAQGFAAQEHYFYVTTKDQNAENKIIELIKQLDGTIIKQESSGNRIFISMEISTRKLKELTDKLKVIGTFGEKSISSAPDKDKIGVRIEILKISS